MTFLSNCHRNLTNLLQSFVAGIFFSRKFYGSMTSYDITGLTEWSCYDVQVVAVTIGDGAWSEVVRQRTSEDGK